MISVMPRILKDDPTAQEFVNELNIAEDYKEPAKRKYNEKSFYFNAFCRLFFCSIIRQVVFPFGLRKWRLAMKTATDVNTVNQQIKMPIQNVKGSEN